MTSSIVYTDILSLQFPLTEPQKISSLNPAPQISRLVNEVYRGYNRHQSPVLVLSVTLSRQQVDVNVTPDKRLLFIQSEKYLLACVKVSGGC